MGPFAIRYPRSRGMSPDWKKPFEALPVGKGRQIREGKDLAFITIGHSGNFALNACEQLMKSGIDAALYDIRFLKPLDEELLKDVFGKFRKIITVEDGTIIGGLGSAVIEFANDHGFEAEIHRLGVPDRFVEQGTIEELHRECGFDVEGIVDAALKLIRN